MTSVPAHDPQRHTGIGAPQNRFREIAQSRALSSHCAEPAISNVLRNPVNVSVVRKQSILQCRDPHEPRAHTPVYQRLIAAPAVWIVVQVRSCSKSSPRSANQPDDP